jgi:hypothetical protein
MSAAIQQDNSSDIMRKLSSTPKKMFVGGRCAASIPGTAISDDLRAAFVLDR